MTHRPLDHHLRLILSRMVIGDVLEIGGWRIIRYPTRFRCEHASGVFHRPAANGGLMKTEFAWLRAISGVVALILGDEAAPELAYANVTRSGSSYQAWHYLNNKKTEQRGWVYAVTAATPEDAYQEYLAWKAYERNIWTNRRSCRVRP